MSKAQEDLTGKRFGRWLVLGRSDRKYYYVCRCDCGTVREVLYSALLGGRSCGCQTCANRAKSELASKQNMENNFLNLQKKYTGATLNSWKIIELIPTYEGKTRCTMCRAICPVCGQETMVMLSCIKKNVITHCAVCNRDIGQKSEAISNVAYVGGSSLFSIQSRMNGRVNKNSSSGANGVCKSYGKWRAYINFQRKQYYLGSYDTIEDAIVARKEAEKLIYAPYLKEHEGWEEELAQKLAELKNKKRPRCSKRNTGAK